MRSHRPAFAFSHASRGLLERSLHLLIPTPPLLMQWTTVWATSVDNMDNTTFTPYMDHTTSDEYMDDTASDDGVSSTAP
jgi:hypothetical protein